MMLPSLSTLVRYKLNAKSANLSSLFAALLFLTLITGVFMAASLGDVGDVFYCGAGYVVLY